jgi:hypothetical protein
MMSQLDGKRQIGTTTQSWILIGNFELLLFAGILAVVGCNDGERVFVNGQAKPSVSQAAAERAAVAYATRDTELTPRDVRVESNRKDGFWLVTVVQLPEVPDGFVGIAVMDDGSVTNYYEMVFKKHLIQEIEASKQSHM